MSCCKTYDPCLDNKINQIGSYASAARQSAQNSAASAAAADADATSAAASAAAAAISAGIAGIYLGAFAVPPTTDNTGGPLQDGMLYYNTGSNTLFVWNGSSWSAIDDDEIYLGGFAVAPTLNNQGLPLVSGNLYWNSVTNDLWAYDGLVWVVVDFNEFTPFLATGSTFARNLVTRSADFINVADYGAKGDGITDDTAAIQAAVNEAMKVGKMVYFFGPGPFLISSKIQILATRNLAPTAIPPSQGVHISDVVNATIIGFGMPTIKAIAPMASMFELIYDVSDSDIGPFYSKIEGMGFDGNNLATTGIKVDYTMHVEIQKNRLWNLERGIEYFGYGVTSIYKNVFLSKIGIYLVGGGGDTVIFNNDFYTAPATNNCVGIYHEYFSGNTKILSNVFTNELNQNLGDVSYCIQMSTITALGNQEVRDVIIENNEFCGYATAIRVDGKPSVKSIYRILVSGNHTNPFGSYNPAQLIAAVDATEFTIVNNFCNTKTFNFFGANQAIDLVRCERFKISQNRFSNYETAAIAMTDCTDCDIAENSFIDCARASVTGRICDIYGALSERNYFKNNFFRQTNASYGQYVVYENAGVDYTYALNNIFEGFSEGYLKVGSNSVMRREEFLSAIPVAGRYYQGDIVWNTNAAAGGAPGWICTTSGGTGSFVFKAMANLAP
jgi:hypothetical protein